MFEVWAKESSCVRFFGYEGTKKFLRVSFIGGSTYDYFFVDREGINLLLEAKSVGAAYRSQIKGKFPSRKLSSEEEEKWVRAVVGGFEVRRLRREIEAKEAELGELRNQLAKMTKFCH